MIGEKVNQKPGTALNEVAVNTILTMVVRVKQPVTVKLVSGREYDIVWNPHYTEPEIIVPGTTAIDNRGIAQVLRWLEKQTAVIDWYPQTKHHTQPE